MQTHYWFDFSGAQVSDYAKSEKLRFQAYQISQFTSGCRITSVFVFLFFFFFGIASSYLSLSSSSVNLSWYRPTEPYEVHFCTSARFLLNLAKICHIWDLNKFEIHTLYLYYSHTQVYYETPSAINLINCNKPPFWNYYLYIQNLKKKKKLWNVWLKTVIKLNNLTNKILCFV